MKTCLIDCRFWLCWTSETGTSWETWGFQHTWSLTESFYHKWQAAVRLASETLNWFAMQRGINQDSNHSPFMFNIYASYVMINVKNKTFDPFVLAGDLISELTFRLYRSLLKQCPGIRAVNQSINQGHLRNEGWLQHNGSPALSIYCPSCKLRQTTVDSSFDAVFLLLLLSSSRLPCFNFPF